MSTTHPKLPPLALESPEQFVDSLTLSERIALARRHHVGRTKRKRSPIELLIAREKGRFPATVAGGAHPSGVEQRP